jgi:hypothetical protein
MTICCGMTETSFLSTQTLNRQPLVADFPHVNDRRMKTLLRLLLAFMVGVVLSRAPRTDKIAADYATSESDEIDAGAIGDVFVYDVAARFNENLLASNDAADNALMGVLAGTAAVAALAIDKLRETTSMSEILALGLLSASALVCLLGYALSFPWTSVFSARDGTRPRRFTPDFIDNPEAATASAIEEMILSGEANLLLRRRKRAMVVLAIILFLIGTVVVAIALLRGKVV